MTEQEDLGNLIAGIVNRFWSHVARAGPEECWLWHGEISGSDHPQPTFAVVVAGHRQRRIASRVAYQLTFGSVSDELKVCHHCDNSLCCNPAHLFVGTQADNLRDMREKSRAAKHERHGHAKITMAAAEEIRSRVANGETQRSLAKQFGISYQTVWQIIHYEIWS